MGLTLTKSHLDAARRAGACDSGLRYPIGTPLSNIKSQHLDWFEETFPDAAAEIAEEAAREAGIKSRAALPLAIFGYGSGDGYGYGSGDGSGYGYGYGYGAN